MRGGLARSPADRPGERVAAALTEDWANEEGTRSLARPRGKLIIRFLVSLLQTEAGDALRRVRQRAAAHSLPGIPLRPGGLHGRRRQEEEQGREVAGEGHHSGSRSLRNLTSLIHDSLSEHTSQGLVKVRQGYVKNGMSRMTPSATRWQRVTLTGRGELPLLSRSHQTLKHGFQACTSHTHFFHFSVSVIIPVVAAAAAVLLFPFLLCANDGSPVCHPYVRRRRRIFSQ